MGFKIYTRTGDTGETGLYGGSRASKDDVRIEAYGTVDELNAALGLLLVHIRDASDHGETKATPSTAAVDAQLDVLASIQSELFTVGSQLATPPEKPLSIVPIGEGRVTVLEQQIDALDAELPALTNFVLPGGTVPAAHAHICRTIARRAERRLVTLHQLALVDPVLIRYLNRLSDYFFTLARALVHVAGGLEEVWVAERS